MKTSLISRIANGLAAPVSPVRMVRNDRDHLYKIQFHQVKPEASSDYQDLCRQELQQIDTNEDVPMQLMASFKTWYGHQDEVIHIWKYKGNGYESHQKTQNELAELDSYRKFREARGKMLTSRRNELVYEFGFWPQMVAKNRNCLYELRSYQLKPGTIADWAGHWNTVFAQKYRVDEPVGGFFSDIGDLNMVYYFWAYKDLQDRLEVRNKAWSAKGDSWQRVVTNTQVLCNGITSSILEPMDFSPTK